MGMGEVVIVRRRGLILGGVAERCLLAEARIEREMRRRDRALSMR